MFIRTTMFRTILLTSLATVALGLDLTVKLNAVSSSVASIEDVIITAVVSNPTTEDIKVLKFASLLDDLPTKSFGVRKGSDDVVFTGIEVIPDLENDASFVTIPAGGSLAVNHTVSALYDFETAGAGTYTFSPRADWVVSEEGASHTLLPISEAISVEIEITEDVAQRPVFPPLNQLSTPVCNDANRKNFIAAALSEARALAGGAAADIRSRPNSAQYTSYFNNNNRDDVWYNFDRIAGDLASSGSRSLFCTDRAGGACSNAGVVAYTLLVTSGGNIVGSDIYMCNGFFGMRATNDVCSGAAFSSTRGNVMLHELAHAVFKAEDVVYGCDGSRGLSEANKKKNADNYSCMALQIKRDFAC